MEYVRQVIARFLYHLPARSMCNVTLWEAFSMGRRGRVSQSCHTSAFERAFEHLPLFISRADAPDSLGRKWSDLWTNNFAKLGQGVMAGRPAVPSACFTLRRQYRTVPQYMKGCEGTVQYMLQESYIVSMLVFVMMPVTKTGIIYPCCVAGIYITSVYCDASLQDAKLCSSNCY